MCAVSAISDWGMRQWPGPVYTPPAAWLPTPQEWEGFKELVRKAAEYDKLVGQPDCPDPKKLEWQAEMEKFMWEKYGLEPGRD